MERLEVLLRSVLITTVLLRAAGAQAVISARAGLVQQIEGDVLIDGQSISPAHGRFPQMTAGSSVTTKQGKAEILLGPDAIAWVGSQSTFQLLRDEISNPRIRLVSGSGIIATSNAALVTLICGVSDITLSGHALIRMEESQLKVLEGETQAKLGDRAADAKQGESLSCVSGVVARSRLHNPDDLDRWVGQRRIAIKTGLAKSARLGVNTVGKPRRRRSMPFPAATMQFPGRFR